MGFLRNKEVLIKEYQWQLSYTLNVQVRVSQRTLGSVGAENDLNVSDGNKHKLFCNGRYMCNKRAINHIRLKRLGK